jgi:hypothetical protein
MLYADGECQVSTDAGVGRVVAHEFVDNPSQLSYAWSVAQKVATQTKQLQRTLTVGPLYT